MQPKSRSPHAVAGKNIKIQEESNVANTYSMLKNLAQDLNDDEILVKYLGGVKAVTPGQACVFYKDDICLGGGIIKEVRKDGKKLWYL